MCRQSATVCLSTSPSPATRELPVLTDRLTALPDPRDRRGRRHSLVPVLLTARAVPAGARSYLAIGQWACPAPQHTLARLGIRAHGPLKVRTPPSASTLRRVLVAVCPGGPADLLGTNPARTDTVAVDGKTAHGSRTDTRAAAHLLAAVTGTGHTVTQLRVPTKTNEVTGFARLLAPFDLTGVTVTADALHTQRDHARHLVEDKNAHYLLLVKGNQPRPHAALRSLPWSQVRARRYDRERGHGRRETRSTRVLTVTDLHPDFPHVVQAAKILRHRTNARTSKATRQTGALHEAMSRHLCVMGRHVVVQPQLLRKAVQARERVIM
ncbi:hypothetical protein GCM10010129_81300 [Streptomyces fumigatiscleroticus]|nr:hypothetical protein GCM10010129_81300 [Streptomyces fumigatiscleroticus]